MREELIKNIHVWQGRWEVSSRWRQSEVLLEEMVAELVIFENG